jgi:DNA-binding protein YbaB
MEPTGADDWVSSYLRRAEETEAMAEEAKSRLAQVAAQLSSPDGAVTLTVNASGALQTLQFGSAAERMSRDQLAGSVLATARQAQAQAAQQVAAAMSPLLGQDSAAMDFLRQQIPGAEEPDAGAEASGHTTGPQRRDAR